MLKVNIRHFNKKKSNKITKRGLLIIQHFSRQPNHWF